jgi:hypothetical protein
MPPTAQYEYPDTEEFIDWQTSARLESLSIPSEEPRDKEKARTQEEDLVSDQVSLWVLQSPPAPRRDDIGSAVRAARVFAELGEDWDGEGSQGYSLNTWKRVKRFVLTHASVSESRFRVTLPVPTINPADQGSLDVFWCLSDRQLLINFPADETAPITYYGQNSQGDNTISGRTAGREHRLDLVAWLIQKTR